MAKKQKVAGDNGMAGEQLKAVQAAAGVLLKLEAVEETASTDLKAAKADVQKALKTLRLLIAAGTPLFEQGKDGPE